MCSLGGGCDPEGVWSVGGCDQERRVWSSENLTTEEVEFAAAQFSHDLTCH